MHVGIYKFDPDVILLCMQVAKYKQEQRDKSWSSLVRHDPRTVFSKSPREIRHVNRFRPVQ